MTNFNVKLNQNNFNVRLQQGRLFKVVSTPGGIQVPAKLEDLIDVNVSDNSKKDKYVLMYDSMTDKYILVNPDEVLSASSNTENTQPGLPVDFLNTLDVDLDNRINLDGGVF